MRTRWTLALVAVAVLAVAGIAFAATSGDDDDKKATKGTNLSEVRCPLAQSGEDAQGAAEYKPAKNSFDTAELIGLSLSDAQAKAAEHTCEIVVSLQDGAGLPVPIDVDPKRIYVYTEDGLVTQIEGVGGGI